MSSHLEWVVNILQGSEILEKFVHKLEIIRDGIYLRIPKIDIIGIDLSTCVAGPA